ncbi:MAG: PepSY-associated TM helix domain-containing protein [Vicinamibacterales bacterium]
MEQWERWLRQPQTVWLRRAAFQVHLWSGLALGLYVLVLSLSGSVLVFRDQLDAWFETPAPAFEPGREGLSTEALTEAAQRAYPAHEVTRVGTRFGRRRPVIEIWLEQGEERLERLFNPYTGEDLGDALPRGIRAVLWLAGLHDELLLGETGRRVNGTASAAVALLTLSGAVVWWPGVRNWRRALTVRWRARWPRRFWDLHSAAGAWCFPLILLWAVSGVYLAIPEPFAAVVDAVSDPEAILGERPGDIVLAWTVRLHFGRFDEQPLLQGLWGLLGLVPGLMFVTGAIMWWNRVLRRRSGRPAEPADPTR